MTYFTTIKLFYIKNFKLIQLITPLIINMILLWPINVLNCEDYHTYWDEPLSSFKNDVGIYYERIDPVDIDNARWERPTSSETLQDEDGNKTCETTVTTRDSLPLIPAKDTIYGPSISVRPVIDDNPFFDELMHIHKEICKDIALQYPNETITPSIAHSFIKEWLENYKYRDLWMAGDRIDLQDINFAGNLILRELAIDMLFADDVDFIINKNVAICIIIDNLSAIAGDNKQDYYESPILINMVNDIFINNFQKHLEEPESKEFNMLATTEVIAEDSLVYYDDISGEDQERLLWAQARQQLALIREKGANRKFHDIHETDSDSD